MEYLQLYLQQHTAAHVITVNDHLCPERKRLLSDRSLYQECANKAMLYSINTPLAVSSGWHIEWRKLCVMILRVYGKYIRTQRKTEGAKIT